MSIVSWCACHGITKANYYYRLRRVRKACLETIQAEMPAQQMVPIQPELLQHQEQIGRNPQPGMLIMCSQIMGCASVSSKEMVEMLREGSTIEIEVAVPSYYEEEQGTESNLAWTELGSQSNYQEFRMGFDDLFKVMSFDLGKKNGPCYIELEGNWTNNSTLHSRRDRSIKGICKGWL